MIYCPHCKPAKNSRFDKPDYKRRIPPVHIKIQVMHFLEESHAELLSMQRERLARNDFINKTERDQDEW